MSIRRRSTAHDLATLRLHPDGSRVQQSSVNTRHRTAGSTVIDSRGNWVAKDAGGKSSVKTRRNVSKSLTGDADGEFIDLSGDEERALSQSKGKQRARDSQTPDEDSPQEPEPEQLDSRTKRRLSFLRDLSFLDPPLVSVSSLEQDTDHSAREPAVFLPDPAPDLLKAVHHFASCYYRERGQLFDSSRYYRGEKTKGYKQSQENVHTLAANVRRHQSVDSEAEHTEVEDETTEEGEDQSEVADTDDSGGEGPGTKVHIHKKDMYRAFDGSALMAIGVVLQEHVAHTLLPRLYTSDESRSSKRRRTG